jgi:hypothetical protein
MSLQSKLEYQSKKTAVLEKFTKEFVSENYNTDPTFHAIVHMLMNDADPYTIIERLINDRKEFIKKMEDFMTHYGAPIPMKQG